ncbi:MAG TPA: U32 family peptidase [Candidatus Methanoperedens sp.]|nr:U32 family peptidase [Candidatus Methanoperedens sp.]
MKILCPVDSAAEAALLPGLGAGELYGGYVPAAWSATYALAAPPNRRAFAEAQIADPGELRATIAAAHAAGSEFFLAVNSPLYAEEQYPALFALVEEALAAGADALIAADPGFVIGARERWPQVRVHLSTLADAANHGAVEFWRRLGVERVTLPRHLPLAAMTALLAATPAMRFDAFVLYGQCPNDEGQCTFSHDHPARIWPCVRRWRIEPLADAEPALAAAAAQRGWGGLSRADACGLCALWDLARLGVEAVKIVGRGASTERKAWAVRTVGELLALVASGVGRQEYLAAARARSRARFAHGCNPYLCYFPELIPRPPAAADTTPPAPLSQRGEQGGPGSMGT